MSLKNTNIKNEKKEFKRIGVLTSGGDSPGMNAALRAITRYAIECGVEVMGIYEGYKGLITGSMKLFSERDVSNIINHGGTVLYSARCLEFIEVSGQRRAIEVCNENKIDGIVTIGGDGTFRGATDLTNGFPDLPGIPCIGIPGTIDNDISSTDYTVGYDTAMNTVVEMVDRLRDTCESHCRCNVVEVMGRHSGCIALNTGIAVGATAIAVSEMEFNEEAAIKSIIASKNGGKRNFIIVMSEGVNKNINLTPYSPEYAKKLAEFDAYEIKNAVKPHSSDLPYTEKFARRIEYFTGVETRFCRPAHIVRGGSPSLRDRVVAAQMGTAAVDLLLGGQSKKVVCLQNDKIVSVDINYALILDRMYKDKLRPGDLDAYTSEQAADMRKFCEAKKRDFAALYEMAHNISK